MIGGPSGGRPAPVSFDGLSTIEALIKFVTNKAEVKRVVEELQSKIDELNTKLEALGVTKDAQKYLAEAREERQIARKEGEKATEALRDAQEKAKQAMKDADDYSEAVCQQADDKLQQASRLKQNAENERADFDQWKVQEQLKLDKKWDEINAQIKRLTEKEAKLDQAIARYNRIKAMLEDGN